MLAMAPAHKVTGEIHSYSPWCYTDVLFVLRALVTWLERLFWEKQTLIRVPLLVYKIQRAAHHASALTVNLRMRLVDYEEF